MRRRFSKCVGLLAPFWSLSGVGGWMYAEAFCPLLIKHSMHLAQIHPLCRELACIVVWSVYVARVSLRIGVPDTTMPQRRPLWSSSWSSNVRNEQWRRILVRRLLGGKPFATTLHPHLPLVSSVGKAAFLHRRRPSAVVHRLLEDILKLGENLKRETSFPGCSILNSSCQLRFMQMLNDSIYLKSHEIVQFHKNMSHIYSETRTLAP